MISSTMTFLFSNASIFLVSTFLNLQHSEPYKNNGINNNSYTFIFVVTDTFRDFHILLNFPTAEANTLLLFMSCLHSPSSVVILPRYTKSVTCCKSSLSRFVDSFFVLPSNRHCFNFIYIYLQTKLLCTIINFYCQFLELFWHLCN